jgi:vacuolar-type H+-ATPase subunit F/Vma7
MARVAYIGDEVSAAGYRLAGARVHVPGRGEELSAIESARGEADLVLVGATCAARVGAPALAPLLRQEAPLLVVVPDAGPGEPDIGARLRRQLGF